jgi:hypothetical protein
MSQSPAAVDYPAAIRAAQGDPQRLEDLYRAAGEAYAADTFANALVASYREAPDNLLYAAWYYRLQGAAPEARPARHPANWRLAVPLSVLLALTLWALSDVRWTVVFGIPYVAVLWAPITALFLIAFLTLSTRQHYLRAALLGVILAAASAYILAMTLRAGEPAGQTYLMLMLLHLPLLSGVAVGLAVLGFRSSARDRFAFLAKSVETIGTAGVASIAGGIFVGLTYGIFEALSVDIPDVFVRLLVAGGAGLIPVLAVAAVYDPALPPGEQEFRRGFGRILAILMRALLPLTLLVLAIYLFFIPFNFQQPFVHRDVLVIFNVLLFAIMGLLIGVTPVQDDDVPTRFQRLLRTGIIALAVLVTVVSIYALAAVLYRTAGTGLSMNRLVVIGWNVLNIGILLLLLARQVRPPQTDWVDSLQGTFRFGTLLYVAWPIFLTLALPWLF